MQVAKWGNSLAVRLPAAVVQALELKEGEEIHSSAGPEGTKRNESACRRGFERRPGRDLLHHPVVQGGGAPVLDRSLDRNRWARLAHGEGGTHRRLRSPRRAPR